MTKMIAFLSAEAERCKSVDVRTTGFLSHFQSYLEGFVLIQVKGPKGELSSEAVGWAPPLSAPTSKPRAD